MQASRSIFTRMHKKSPLKLLISWRSNKGFALIDAHIPVIKCFIRACALDFLIRSHIALPAPDVLGLKR